MDRQAKILRKRQQRHSRETSARLDQFISHYVQHKYNNIYAEAKEFHDRLKSLYPYKHDLRKTVEYDLWKKQIQIHPQESPTQGTADREHTDNMELKIQLINCKKMKTTTTVETGSSVDEVSTTTAEETTTTIETGSSVDEIVEENITPSINEEISTGLLQEIITPSINEEISTELLQEIITELNTERYLNDMFTDLDFEMLGCDINIDEQYTLEDELAKY